MNGLNNYPIDELPSVDAQNMVAQYASNVLYNDFKLIFNEDDKDQTEFVKALKRNDLLRIFKSMEENLSKDGWGYLYGDIGPTDPFGNPIKDIEIQYLSFNKVVPYGYQNRLLYGATVNRTILYGTGSYPIEVQQILTPGLVYTSFTSTPNSINEIVVSQIVIDTPHFYDRYNRLGERRTKYKSCNIEPFFNKDFTFGSGNFNKTTVKLLDGQAHEVFTFQHLSDHGNVKYYEFDINSFLDFIKQERVRNATKGVFAGGTLQSQMKDQQFLTWLSSKHQDQYLLLQAQSNNPRKYAQMRNALAQQYNFDDNQHFLDGSVILLSGNKENTAIDKMQSTYNLTELLSGIEKQLKLYGEGCGYNYNADITEGSYNNVTAVQSHNQLTLQTVKAKKSLREKAINEMLLKMYSAGVDYNQDKIKDFQDNFKFEIICNAINDQYKNPNVIISAVQSNIKSRKQAIIDLNPNGSDEQVEAELMEIYTDIKTMNALDFDGMNNQDNSKEQNNIGDNPQKAKVDGDNE